MRRSWRAAGAVLIAATVAGCPPPTGRHRGWPGDGGGGPCPIGAERGLACGEPGSFCTITTSCCSTPVVSQCDCNGGSWECATAECWVCDSGYPYDSPYIGYDAPPDPSCPADVMEGASCPPELGGVLCRGGLVSDCDGGTRTTSCACITGTWTCDAAGCDGG